jgi:hypothetical protein
VQAPHLHVVITIEERDCQMNANTKEPLRCPLPARRREKDAEPLPSKKSEPKEEFFATEQETAALLNQVARIKASSWTPHLKVESGRLVPDHPDEVIGLGLVAQALGVRINCALAQLDQLAQLARRGDVIDQQRANALFGSVQEIGPTNGIEAMLALQMAAVHDNAMMAGSRLRSSQNIVEQDSTERAFNKLCRTYTSQMETLKRFRTAGENATVQNVQVNEGGQAVVANLGDATSGTTLEKATKSPPAGADRQTFEATVKKAALLQFKRRKKS